MHRPNEANGRCRLATWGLPTLGGLQLWSDVFAHAGWRIQEYFPQGQYRLLGPSNRCFCFGDFYRCREVFAEQTEKSFPNWPAKHLVILIHGLGRTRHIFTKLSAQLLSDGYATLALSYASTRGSTAAHAQRLRRLLDGLRGIETVSFVTHSFGGLVLRQALRRPFDLQPNRQVPWGRAVLLAPPNQGSAVAERLKNLWLFKYLLGKGGQSVTPDAVRDLPGLSLQFGIIAGGGANGAGINPFLHGDNDGIVRVCETSLKGAADFQKVNALHTFIMRSDDSIAATRAFLKYGKFGRGA